MVEKLLKSLRNNIELTDYEVYANLNKEVIATFHIVNKQSHLGVSKEHDKKIKCDFKM